MHATSKCSPVGPAAMYYVRKITDRVRHCAAVTKYYLLFSSKRVPFTINDLLVILRAGFSRVIIELNVPLFTTFTELLYIHQLIVCRSTLKRLRNVIIVCTGLAFHFYRFVHTLRHANCTGVPTALSLSSLYYIVRLLANHRSIFSYYPVLLSVLSYPNI